MQFAIQARLIERHGDVVVRNETRLNTATALSDAVRTATAHAADGFTVWIYEVRPDGGGPPTYVPVDTLRPDVRARPEGACPRTPTDAPSSTAAPAAQMDHDPQRQEAMMRRQQPTDPSTRRRGQPWNAGGLHLRLTAQNDTETGAGR